MKIVVIGGSGFTAVYESAEVLLRSRKLHETLCLIVDVQMPEIGGLELQSQLAAKGCAIPITFITAHWNETFRHQAMQAGAVAFLDKPFGDEQLLKNIRSAFKTPEKETRLSRCALSAGSRSLADITPILALYQGISTSIPTYNCAFVRIELVTVCMDTKKMPNAVAIIDAVSLLGLPL